MDENSPEVWAFVVDEGLDSLKEQFGETDYGKEKYPPECLFWMGYMYRYICYTREERTRFVMQLFPHQLMNHVFPAYHTQDPEWVIASLLEDQNLPQCWLDKNERHKIHLREFEAKAKLETQEAKKAKKA